MLQPVAAFGEASSSNDALQKADQEYSFDNKTPAWEQDQGPLITVHRYVSPYVQRGALSAFGRLVATDGFQIQWLDKALDAETLQATKILVIANAYTKGGALDYQNFSTLEAPSVYSDETILLIRNWVEDGGALLVLADHSPFAGGTIKLLEAFGITAITGHAIHRASGNGDMFTTIDFRRTGTGRQIGRLSDHAITSGALGRQPIEHFFTFGGQALLPAVDMQNLLTIPENYESLLTFALHRDFDTAMRIDSSGLSQGAVGSFGKGRIAVFGETGAFTSQSIKGAAPFGLAAPEADQNAEFVLSTLRWLVDYKP